MESTSIEERIRSLALKLSEKLKSQIDGRMIKMESDDLSHFLVYRVLGITDEEGKQIDLFQNKGRFLYRFAGSFLETACTWCFQEKFPDAVAVKIPNTEGKKPKKFQIDCLVGSDAIEIKWRDATTDGDHITKEHTRIAAIAKIGYTPIRVMFYYPNRDAAIRIQQTLETLYNGKGGQYYFGDSAWGYVQERTEIDFKGILEKLADEREKAG